MNWLKVSGQAVKETVGELHGRAVRLQHYKEEEEDKRDRR